jgi:hypothetical protein
MAFLLLEIAQWLLNVNSLYHLLYFWHVHYLLLDLRHIHNLLLDLRDVYNFLHDFLLLIFRRLYLLLDQLLLLFLAIHVRISLLQVGRAHYCANSAAFDGYFQFLHEVFWYLVTDLLLFALYVYRVPNCRRHSDCFSYEILAVATLLLWVDCHVGHFLDGGHPGPFLLMVFG